MRVEKFIQAIEIGKNIYYSTVNSLHPLHSWYNRNATKLLIKLL